MNNGKAWARGAAIAYSAGGLAFVAVPALLMLLVPLADFVPVHPLLLLCVSAGLLLSVACMPIAYLLINGNTLIAPGRYHLPLMLSHFAVALALVGIAYVGAKSTPLQAVALTLHSLVLSLGLQAGSYAYLSIGRRGVPAEQKDKVFARVKVFATLSFALAALGIALLPHDKDGVQDVLTLAAIAVCASLVSVYLSSVKHMARFMRVEPFHRRSVRESFCRFFAPFSSHVRTRLLCASLVCAALTVLLCAYPAFCGAGRFKLCVGTLCAAAVVSALPLLQNRDAQEAVALGASIAAVCGVTLGLVLPLLLPHAAAKAVSSVAGATLGGFSLGACLPCVLRAAQNSGVTEGRSGALLGCFITLGTAVGIAFAALLWYGQGKNAQIAQVCFAVAFAVLLLGGSVWRFVASRKEKGDVDVHH